MSSIPEIARQIVEYLRQDDPDFMREYIQGLVREDPDFLRELEQGPIEFPPAPVEDVSRDAPILLPDGRFKIDATDSDADFFETKITDGDTVRGTKIAGDWEETGDDGTKKIRQVFVPVDEIQDEITDFAGIAIAVTFAYQSSSRGSATTTLNALDWRDRLVYYKLGWDNEVVPNVWQHYQEGLKITNVDSTGQINLFSVNMGGDTATVFIDGDDAGKLKLTSVDNGNFGDIGCLVEATDFLFGS